MAEERMKRWRWLRIHDRATTLEHLIRLLNERLKALADFLAAGGPGDGLYAAEGFLFNAGNVLVAGESEYLDIPSDFTITNAELVGDTAGALSVAVYAASYGGWDPSGGRWTLISASDPLTLSGTDKSQSSMIGWTRTLTGGHYLKFVITGTPTSVTKATATLTLSAPLGAGSAGASPSGPAGGDLSGTYPSPTIIGSVNLTGNPTTTTQSAGDNSTRIATTAYVDTGLALKANLASPTFTGIPAAPTATVGTNTTQLATTAFVAAAIASGASGGTTPDTAPTSPNAADDEFEQATGTGLDTTGGRRASATVWATRNFGPATFSQDSGYGVLTGTAQTTSNLRIAEQVVGAAPWKRRVLLRSVKVASASNFSMVGICVVNNSSGKVITLLKGYNGGVGIAGDRWTNVTTYASAMFSVVDLNAAHIRHSMADPIYMEIEASGTNLIFRYSLDGVVWTTGATEALATFISSVDRVGLVAHNDTNANQPIGVYGWWRGL